MVFNRQPANHQRDRHGHDGYGCNQGQGFSGHGQGQAQAQAQAQVTKVQLAQAITNVDATLASAVRGLERLVALQAGRQANTGHRRADAAQTSVEDVTGSLRIQAFALQGILQDYREHGFLAEDCRQRLLAWQEKVPPQNKTELITQNLHLLLRACEQSISLPEPETVPVAPATAKEHHQRFEDFNRTAYNHGLRMEAAERDPNAVIERWGRGEQVTSPPQYPDEDQQTRQEARTGGGHPLKAATGPPESGRPGNPKHGNRQHEEPLGPSSALCHAHAAQGGCCAGSAPAAQLDRSFADVAGGYSKPTSDLPSTVTVTVPAPRVPVSVLINCSGDPPAQAPPPTTAMDTD